MVFGFFVAYLIVGAQKKEIYRKGELYLIRWTLIKNRFFSLKFHKTVMDDPADLHCHPWNYTSLILWGGYYEHKFKEVYDWAYKMRYVEYKQWYGRLSILHRNGEKPHRLELKPGKPCYTLILTSKKWRDWGFHIKKENDQLDFVKASEALNQY